MKRSIAVTISAIIALIGSILTLGIGMIGALGVLVQRNTVPQGAGVAAAALVGVLVITLSAIWGIATGIGLLLLKGWAQISIIIFASLLALSLLGAPMMLLIPFPTTPGVDAGFLWGFRICMAAFYLLLGAIGIWWLILFTRPSVKVQFSDGVPKADDGGRPLSISVIAWLLILGATSMPVCLLMRVPTILLGFLLTGWAAVLTYTSLLIVLLCLGIGLLRLKPLARTLAIYYSVFGIVNMALFYLRPGYQARMAAIMQASSKFFPSPQPPIVFPWLAIFVMTTAFMGAQIYFLVTRKRAFDPPQSGTPALVP